MKLLAPRDQGLFTLKCCWHRLFPGNKELFKILAAKRHINVTSIYKTISNNASLSRMCIINLSYSRLFVLSLLVPLISGGGRLVNFYSSDPLAKRLFKDYREIFVTINIIILVVFFFCINICIILNLGGIKQYNQIFLPFYSINYLFINIKLF